MTVKSKLRKISVQAYENMAKTGEYLWLFCIFTLTLQSAKIRDVPKKGNEKIYYLMEETTMKKFIALSAAALMILSFAACGNNHDADVDADAENTNEVVDENVDANVDENADANVDENADANADENADANADENADANAEGADEAAAE